MPWEVAWPTSGLRSKPLEHSSLQCPLCPAGLVVSGFLEETAPSIYLLHPGNRWVMSLLTHPKNASVLPAEHQPATPDARSTSSYALLLVQASAVVYATGTELPCKPTGRGNKSGTLHSSLLDGKPSCLATTRSMAGARPCTSFIRTRTLIADLS